MSAHRQLFPPEPLASKGPRTWVIVTWFVVAAVVSAIAEYLLEPVAQATPVRTPEVVVFPLEPIDGQRLAAIRAEAFRAGLAEGLQQGGCTAGAPLSLPVAQR